MEYLVVSALSGFAVKAVAFVVLIGVLVVIHEFGHYIMSKRARVPVEEFSVGFGPIIARLGRRGETVFNLRAVPLGGFVRTVGMEPGDDTPEGYNRQPLWTRAKIISAGAIINLIFGFVLFVALGLTWGLPSEEDGHVKVQEVLSGSPAERAGLQKGDTFISLNGAPVKNARTLQETIQNKPNVPVQLVVSRHGVDVTLTAVPRAETQDGKTVGLLGFKMEEEAVWQRYGLADSVRLGWQRSIGMAAGILHTLTTRAAYKDGQLGGPILIAQVAGGTAEKGLNYYLWFMAMLSINLGVLNLLPLPVLDGGHLVLLAIEGVMRRKPSPRFVLAFQSVGMAILFAFFMFVMASDIRRLIGG